MSLKRSISALALLALATGCQTTSLPDVFVEDKTGLADQTNVIVLLESETAANALAINATRRGYVLIEKQTLTGLGLVYAEFERPAGVSGTVAISDMRKMEPSATAGVDHFFGLQSDGDAALSYDPKDYAAQLVQWPAQGCRASLSVGIIDGEIDATSDRLSAANIEVRDFTNGRGVAKAHGTAIADLLVGPGKLLNTGLYAATVVNESSNGVGAGVGELILALNWMVESEVKLINISLAGPYNFLLEEAVNKAADRGAVIVAAAGNDGPDAEPRYPAAFENVIAVTAIDSTLEVYSQAVRGDHIDFAAPGVDVFTSAVDEGRFLSGTSMAAPFVTALIASDPQLDPRDDISAIRSMIGETAMDIGPAGHDPIYGAGLPRKLSDCQ